MEMFALFHVRACTELSQINRKRKKIKIKIMEKHWGIIKRIDGNVESTPIKLFKNTYHFGRAKGVFFCVSIF